MSTRWAIMPWSRVSSTGETRAALMLRRIVAGVIGFCAFLPFLIRFGDDHISVWSPGIAAGIAAALVWRPTLGAQLFARSAWWANLLLAVALSADGGGNDREAILAIGSGVALLIMGDRGIAEAKKRSAFAPAAFAGTLALAIMLAMADTLSLTLIFMVHADDGDPEAFILLGCALAMVVGLVGLYRIRTWGVVANIVTNIVVATLALSGAFDVPDEFVVLFVCTALLQLVVPIPMAVSLRRNKPLLPPLPAHIRRGVAQAVIGGLMGLSVFMVAL